MARGIWERVSRLVGWCVGGVLLATPGLQLGIWVYRGVKPMTVVPVA
jgi:hypothetical protein